MNFKYPNITYKTICEIYGICGDVNCQYIDGCMVPPIRRLLLWLQKAHYLDPDISRLFSNAKRKRQKRLYSHISLEHVQNFRSCRYIVEQIIWEGGGWSRGDDGGEIVNIPIRPSFSAPTHLFGHTFWTPVTITDLLSFPERHLQYIL